MPRYKFNRSEPEPRLRRALARGLSLGCGDPEAVRMPSITELTRRGEFSTSTRVPWTSRQRPCARMQQAALLFVETAA